MSATNDGCRGRSVLPFFALVVDGQFYSSDKLPFEPGFKSGNITTNSAGGFLPILPIVGASGPQDLTGFPLPDGTTALEERLLSFAIGSPAASAVNLTVSPAVGTQIVGAPTLTLTYSGLGTSRHVYARIVDNADKRTPWYLAASSPPFR